MNITNVIDYDNIPSTNISLCNCTNNEYHINRTILLLIFTIPCSISFLFLLSIVVYTLIKPKLKLFK